MKNLSRGWWRTKKGKTQKGKNNLKIKRKLAISATKKFHMMNLKLLRSAGIHSIALVLLDISRLVWTKKKSRLVVLQDVESSFLLILFTNAVMGRQEKSLINFALITLLKKTTKILLGVQLLDVQRCLPTTKPWTTIDA